MIISTEAKNIKFILINNKNLTILMRKQQEIKQQKYDKLQPIHFWAYGVGHFINDLVVSCWFNFLLYFLKRVVETKSAPYVLLIGQITDGIVTPLVGYFSDKFQSRFGKRMPWYFFGVMLVTISFLPLFVVVNSTDQFEFVYYVGFGIIFSIGWAAVQISHMSLVPSLTLNRQRRDRLNNRRNLFTFISNFYVLGLGLAIFSFIDDTQIQFLIIAIATLALGVAASIFFMCKINQKQLSLSIQKGQNYDKNQKHSNWKWFKMPSFYLFGFCYMGVRVYTNIFGTLLPFYLVQVLNMGSSTSSGVSFNLALVPLICYFSSVLAAAKLNHLYRSIGRKKTLGVGTIICVFSLSITYFLMSDFGWVIYYLSIFIGISQAMVLGTGINLISQVVGPRGSKGAFVFGVYSFIDKIMVGVIIYLVSNTSAYTNLGQLNEQELQFIKLTFCLIPGLGCLLGALIVILYPIPQYNNDNGKNEGNELIQQNSNQSSDGKIMEANN